MDLFHRFTNWLSYNRWTALGLVLGVALVGLASCQFKATDPVSHQAATASELEANQASHTDQLRRDQDKAKADYDIQVKVLQDTTAAELLKLQAKFAASTDQRMADAKKLEADYAEAQRTIADKQAVAAGVLTFVQNTLGAVNPGLAAGLAGLFALTTAGLGLDNRRKDGRITTLNVALASTGTSPAKVG